jgi:hypothetical protein
MKLQRTTWGLVAIAALLGVGVYIYETQKQPHSETIQANSKAVFDLKKEDIQSLTIETPKETLKFEQTGDENQPWRMIQPETTLANDAVISFLLTLLVDGKSDHTFKILVEQRQDYGLDKPLATIRFQLKNQQTHQLILGKPDFNNEFLYAQIDPPDQPEKEITLSLVSKDFQYAVERDLTEWKQPQESPEKTEKE